MEKIPNSLFLWAKAHNPKLISEWDKQKNVMPIEEVTIGSDKKVWWKCDKGHSWEATISSRKGGRNCPYCSKGRHVSFPEKAVAYYFHKIDDSIIEGFSDSSLKITELDVYSPKKGIGIEYDGKKWHGKQTIKRDIAKNDNCKCAGITLYRIRENGCEPIINSSSVDIYYNPNDRAALEGIIRDLIKRIYNINCIVDLEKDRIEIYTKIDIWFEQNSAAVIDSTSLSEWNYEKNRGLRPENFSANTHKKVWWICSRCGGEWQSSVANRNMGRGCPYCSGHKLLQGFNDLATVAPTLLDEWDYDKNSINPSNITAHSAKTVWWKCKHGHSYQAKVSNRVDLGRGCPVCANKKIIPGVNDLATTYPELLKEWDFSKNKISPTEIPSGTNKKIWWKCIKCGHEWQASPNARTSKKAGCPRCAESKKGSSIKQCVIQVSKEGDIIMSYSSVKDAA